MDRHTKIISWFSLLLFVILQACTGSKVMPSDTLSPEPIRETAAPQIPSATPTQASSKDAENTPTAGPTPVQFSGMITVPNDPNLIPYPDFYLEASESSVGISDPYCAISSEMVSYPKEYLGNFPLPDLRDGPLPPEIRRGVGLVDVWGCCLNMPSLNFGCETSLFR